MEDDVRIPSVSNETIPARQELTDTPIITPLDSIEPKPVRWLWPNRIP